MLLTIELSRRKRLCLDCKHDMFASRGLRHSCRRRASGLLCTQADPALAAMYVRCAPRSLLKGRFRHLAFEFYHEITRRPVVLKQGTTRKPFPRSLEGPRRNAMRRLVDFIVPLADSGESGPNIEASLLLQAPVKPSMKLPEGEFCRL
ncbi:uncharacterized protein ARMOST_00093 [Armillaria ostoyae]|uniref:Uncharacterized protein n=1 Tax=Armillaria ostoyae TaxID=47428 RepID=A0A284QK57_ARMOS|nr:uncharacterized protein ARMOST_00093 [Armillaria ostoyae]